MRSSVNARPVDAKELREQLLKRIKGKLSRGAELSLYEFVVNELLNRGELSLREISEDVAIPERTIEKIATGASPDPLVSNCEKLATYFRLRNKDSDKALERA